MTQTVCCEQCLENIARRNTSAASFWCHLCQVMATGYGSSKKYQHVTLAQIEHYLKLLERIGLLFTHEDDSLYVHFCLKAYKLKGNPNLLIYCGKPLEHSEEI
jgi:hypothetical protein